MKAYETSVEKITRVSGKPFSIELISAGVLSGTAPQIIRSSVSNSAGWELNSKSVFLAGNFPALITC